MEWIIGGFILYVIVKAINSNKEDEEKKQKQEEQLARQKAAEAYIMESGDQEAMKQLMLMRANPANYRQQFAQAAKGGNSTMNTAFGVMTGLVAADMITTSMHTAAIEDALANLDTELDAALSEIDPGIEVPDTDVDGEDISDNFDNLFG